MPALIALIAACFLTLTLSAQEPASGEGLPTADIILWGGPIYTADDANPTAEAVAIKDGILLRVGTRSAVESLRGPDTEIIDLKGNAAFPGFTDSHVHLAGIGKRALSLNLDTALSLTAFKTAVREWRAAHPDTPLIIGSGWIETHWPEARFPTRWDLDQVVADIPVLLHRADHHALVANSRALEIAGITPDTPAPFGGALQKNALGELTGMLVDNAQGLVASLMPAETEADIREQLITGSRISAEYGWTSLHNMAIPYDQATLLAQLSDEGSIQINVYNSVDPESAEKLFEEGPQSSQNGKVRTAAIKLFMDGALGSRGAALLEPYSDADTTGLMLTTREETYPRLLTALEKGIQINTHAIGDKANRLILDWYEQAFAAVPTALRAKANPRWRVEHAQILSLEDIPRFAALGVIPSMQPSHAIGDLHFAGARLGTERLAGAYSWQSLIKSGAIIAGGSDAPVEQGNPMTEFYAATIRRDLQGYSGETWHPEEAVSRGIALKMFTLWPAMASFQETTSGSLTAGKLADISVFNTDLMTAEAEVLSKAHAMMTIVRGDIIFRHSDFTN